jgi:hypothetical protein
LDLEIFRARFVEAAKACRDSARGFLEQSLPEPIRFDVVLNASYDGNPLHADEQVFPDDVSQRPASATSRMLEDEVVQLLFRNGLVPEWVNLAVVGTDAEATIIEVVVCGRFTANENRLYHADEGRPPFHVLGPVRLRPPNQG